MDAKHINRLEQAGESVVYLSGMWGRMFNELLDRGLTRPEALALVKEYIKHAFGPDEK